MIASRYFDAARMAFDECALRAAQPAPPNSTGEAQGSGLGNLRQARRQAEGPLFSEAGDIRGACLGRRPHADSRLSAPENKPLEGLRGAMATLCFAFAVSKATKAPWSALRASGSARPARATLASLLHKRAGRRPPPGDITSRLKRNLQPAQNSMDLRRDDVTLNSDPNQVSSLRNAQFRFKLTACIRNGFVANA